MQLGVVRHTERFLDSPTRRRSSSSRTLADDVRAILHAQVPETCAHAVGEAIAVGGTATSAAAIALELDPYDAAKVEGYLLLHAILEEETADLAALTDDERRHVPGLHPDRAPTIVAGVIILRECIRALGLRHVEVSEHDILRGAALWALQTRCGRLSDCHGLDRRSIIAPSRAWVACRKTRYPAWYIGPGEAA